MTPEREAEIREVAKMGGWDGDPRAVALTKCIRDLLDEFDRLRPLVTLREAGGQA